MAASNELTLGFVQDYDAAYLANAYFPNKIGGKPAWLELREFPPSEVFQCSQCSNPLSFLGQIYAPLLDDYNFHRTIYIFICRSTNCQKVNNADNILVLRSQLAKINDFYPEEPPNENDSPVPAIPPCIKICAVCGCPAPFQCSSCNKINYCSKSHQNAHWSTHKPDCLGKGVAIESKALKSINFPELDIAMETLKNQAKQKVANANEEKSTEELMEIFDKLKLAGETGKLSEESEEVLEQFCGKETDKAFNRFKKAVAGYDDQIIRYDCGSEPLWIADKNQTITEQLASIPPCNSCGAARMFEFQIMPQLLIHLKDDKIDWGVLAIYTCKDSCPITGYVKEHVIRQDIN